MSVHLITGYKGKEHIQSKDTRSFNAAMFGAGEFVMEIGEQIGASITNNNTVRVLDGDILMQGAHIRIETGTYEDLTVTTGTAGKKRIDLIVMTYEKDASQGTELAFLEVIKGTETEGTASVPEYTTGVLSEGALKNQMPLYKVEIEGVVLSTIEPLFKTIPTYKKLAEQYAAQFEATINALKGADILDTIEEIQANTQGNMFAGALGVKEGFAELNNSLTSHNHDSRYYTESEINTKLNAKQDNSSALKITTNYFRVSSTANTDANVNMANITGIASSRIKAVIPCFVASSAFSLTELVLISSPNNTYEFAVKNPTNMNTDAYIRVYTIYV